MYQTLLADSSLCSFLLKLDQHLAQECRGSGCFCGGPLHSAHYPRKPCGLPMKETEHWNIRFSFCCGLKGCRKRSTPPSLRFLGRKVFVSTVVVLVSALRHGITPKRLNLLREMVGVSRRTVERWREWWRDGFVRSPFWKAARALLRKPVEEQALPLSLLEAFPFVDARRRLVALLRFLLPLTTSSRIYAGNARFVPDPQKMQIDSVRET